jgi:hypothetical protein
LSISQENGGIALRKHFNCGELRYIRNVPDSFHGIFIALFLGSTRRAMPVYPGELAAAHY